MSREELKQYLVHKGIKPSLQRIKILEYLRSFNGHPSIDDIYRGLIKINPTLSKTTVYNSIKIFLEKNIVKIVNIDLNEHRYDIDTSLHGHFKCRKCGKIYDFSIDPIKQEDREISDFIIEEVYGTIKGICDKCKKKII